jgi:hypothetical protein
MITIPPVVTVATAVLLLSYVNTPLLSLVGAVRLKDASPKFLAGISNVPMVGAIGDTSNTAVTLPAL